MRLIYYALFIPLFAAVLAAAPLPGAVEPTLADEAAGGNEYCKNADDSSYCGLLSARARELRLAERIEWARLVHYQQPSLFRPRRSLADDPTFFFSPRGAESPADELDATIAAFFSRAAPAPGELHAQCRFPARYAWLEAELQFDPARLVRQNCSELNEWYTGLNPQSLTLIFPTAYVNNPASMFGHTLLRVDGRGQDERTRLLAYSANYAAATGNDGGVAFAVKGIVGGYRGSFSVRPYYEQVKQYGDIENRDIWEYELNLDDAEIRIVLLHLWELGHTWFDYFFFDENCSLFLLSLLEASRPGPEPQANEAAKPRLDLIEELPPWVIPSEAVRVAAAAPGLVRRVTYRPSAATVLRHRLRLLSPELQDEAVELVRGELEPDSEALMRLAPGDRARLYEVAAGYLDYLRLSGAPAKRYRPALARRLMIERSRIEQAAVFPPVPAPKARPDESHFPARFSLGLGTEGDRKFYRLALRPAYHELSDPSAGYPEGSAINFMSVAVRHYEEDKLELESFFPLEIVSISPRDQLIKPWSWTLSAGIVRRRIDRELGKLTGVFRGGPGAAYALGSTRLFFLLDAAAEFSPSYGDGEVSFGAGPLAGAYTFLTDKVRLGSSIGGRRHGVGVDYDWFEAALEASYALAPNHALTLRGLRQGEFGDYWNEALLSLHTYF